ncbi:MAG: hypothetical protein U0105_05455 [Candidatus Obscuribacterales bacterium]
MSRQQDKATVCIGNKIDAWVAHSTICLRLADETFSASDDNSDDAHNLAAEEAIQLADALTDLSKVLVPAGLEKRPTRDEWEKDKNGYYFAHDKMEVWIESRLVIKMRLASELQLGAADACRFADVLRHVASISLSERQQLIDEGNIVSLNRLERQDAVRDLACDILERNAADYSNTNAMIAVRYLCEHYPERLDMWCDRYAHHADADVLFELALQARKVSVDRALLLLETAFQRAPIADIRTNVLQVLETLMRPEEKEDAEKARRVFRRLSRPTAEQGDN